MKGWEFIKDALSILGAAGLFGMLAKVVIEKIFYKRRDNAQMSKVEKETSKTIVEKYLVELNVNEIIQKKCEIIEEKYKDLIFNMQKEHFEIKKDIQGRLEKEMKARIEAEQENEILKNDLYMLRQKSDEQEEKIKVLAKKIHNIENGNS